MKYLGIDYGEKRIGIAVSDESGVIAFPRAVIPNDEKAPSFIKELVEKGLVKGIVMGDTRASGGLRNTVTEEAESFARSLTETCGVEVQLVSEIWSSIEASRYEPEGKVNDASAAAVILQRFLDMRGEDTIPK